MPSPRRRGETASANLLCASKTALLILTRHDHVTPLPHWRGGSSTMKVSSFILHVLSTSLNSSCLVGGSQRLNSFGFCIEQETRRSVPGSLGQTMKTRGACPKQTLSSPSTRPCHTPTVIDSTTSQAKLPRTSQRKQKSTNITRSQPRELPPWKPRSPESQALEPQPPAPPQSSHTVPCHTHPSTSA